MISNYDRTLLWSGSDKTCNLSEPLSAFERYQIKASNGILQESMTEVDKSCQRVDIYGRYQNNNYMIWPFNTVISNGTKTVTMNHFQMLEQDGTNTGVRTFGFNNTANNLNNRIKEVWGINRKVRTDTTGLGSPGEGWTQYNETLLYSGSDWYDNLNLNQPASGFERLKIMVGSGTNGNESINYRDVDAPQVDSAYTTVWDYWGNSTNSYWFGLHTLQWHNGTQSLSAIGMKMYQLGTVAANPYTTTGNYSPAAANAGWRNPIRQIWGINRKV